MKMREPIDTLKYIIVTFTVHKVKPENMLEYLKQLWVENTFKKHTYAQYIKRICCIKYLHSIL